MYFIPEIITNADAKLRCNNAEAYLEICPEKIFSTDNLKKVLTMNKSEGSCQVFI